MDTGWIRRFEEISNNAWPALEVLQYDGWILRFARGVTKRSNSVGMLYPSTLDPAVKIAFCEQVYHVRGIPVCFKVTPAANPEGVDRLLETRGYRIHSYISFQTAGLGMLTEGTATEVILAEVFDPQWMDHFIRMNGFDTARKPTYLAILDHLCLPMCTVSVYRDGTIAAVGLGVTEGRHLGIFDIVVDPAWRNRGLGRLVTTGLMQWGRSRGADTAYLQVLCDNTPALRLYDRLGFRELYQYWYRMK